MGDLYIYLMLLAVPAALLGLYALFRWRYLAAIRRAMAAPSDAESDSSISILPATSDQVAITWSDPALHHPPSAAFADATASTRAMRQRFLTAGVTFTVMASVVVWHGQRPGNARGAVPLAFFATLPSLFVMLAFFKFSPRYWLMAVLGWTAAGVVVLAGVSNVPWNSVGSGLVSGVGFASFGVAAVALVVLRTTRVLLVGFLPLIGVVAGTSVLFAWFLRTVGVDPQELQGAWRPSVVAWGMLATVIGFAAGLREIRRGVRAWFVPVMLVVLGLGMTSGLAHPTMAPALASGIALNALLTVLIWFVFSRFLRLKENGILPDELLHFSACWLTITVLLPFYAATFGAGSRSWIFPFVAYAIVLTVLLWRARQVSPRRPPKRLLLLRVFSRGAIRARLLDLLEDSWRRVGTIEVVVGVDLAARTMSAAALENFLLGRVDRQFLHSLDAADRCLLMLPRALAADGRYPLNELHCVPGVWQRVVDALAGQADVVLMDARGFQATNRGVAYELSVLARRVPLDRIVLLSDRTTDENALSAALQQSWTRSSIGAPHGRPSNPAIQILRCSGKRSLDTPAIINSVFAASLHPLPLLREATGP